MALHPAAYGDSTLAAPGDYRATVTAVVSGDALRVRPPDAEDTALVGLYGVSSTHRSRDTAAAARALMEEQALGQVVTVRPMKTVAGVPYAEIVLPGGDVLNHLLLIRGLVAHDLLTAADDETYAALAQAAQAAQGQPEPALQPDEGAGAVAAPGAAPAPDRTISLEEFRMRRHLRDSAAFEAGREKWAAMPPEYREGVRQHYENALVSADARGADLLANLRSSVEVRRGAVDSARAGIEARRDAIEADRERLADDFDLRLNTRLHQQYLADYYANRAAGRHRSARWSERQAYRYGVRAELDQARVNAEYEVLRREHQDAIRGLTAEERAQAEALHQANTRLRAASIQASDRAARLLRTLVQFDIYDQAIENEAPPSVPLRLVTVIEGAASERSAPFSVDAPLARVDWYADPLRPGASFTGIIRRVEDDRPVARFQSSAPPHESFLLMDGPGEFYAVIDTSGPIGFLVDVFAIDAE